MLRYAALAILLLLGFVVALSLHQPPMRLMPAPAVFVDGHTNVFSTDAVQHSDPRIKLFYATNRLAIGPLEDRVYAVVPGRDMHLGEATIRIGEEGTTWDKIYAWSTGTSADRRPFLHLENLNEQAKIEPAQPLTPEAMEWFRRIDERLLLGHDTDVVVYVHGANTTMERAAGQAAQLHHFTGRNTVVILFAWPTAENFLRYSRDMVTAFGAAPQLVKLMELLSEHSHASKVDIFTYSAGGTVGSSALAMAAERTDEPNPPPLRIGEVYHAAPDADFRAFVTELRDYAHLCRRVTISVNLNDSALRLSQLINRASRAGRPDMRELDAAETEWVLEAAKTTGLEVLRVRPENIPGLSRGSHTFWYDDPWVSSDVLITLLYHLPPDGRGLHGDITPSGVRYWTFDQDYPQHLARVLDELQRQGKVLSEAAE